MKLFSVKSVNKVSIGSIVILYLAGLILLGLAIMPYIMYKGWIPVEGTVAGFYNQDKTLVEYLFNGVSYKEYMAEFSDTYKLGNAIKILVNPNNPREIACDTAVSHVVQFVFAGILLASAIGTTIFEIIKRHNLKNPKSEEKYAFLHTHKPYDNIKKE